MNKKKQKEIKANLEYLRKLFIMPESPDKFIEFGHELLEMIHDFFQEKGGIHSAITLPELSEIFDQTTVPGSPHPRLHGPAWPVLPRHDDLRSDNIAFRSIPRVS